MKVGLFDLAGDTVLRVRALTTDCELGGLFSQLAAGQKIVSTSPGILCVSYPLDDELAANTVMTARLKMLPDDTLGAFVPLEAEIEFRTPSGPDAMFVLRRAAETVLPEPAKTVLRNRLF